MGNLNLRFRTISLLLSTVIAVLALPRCTCGGSYPRGSAGAGLQQNAMNLRIAADTLRFMRNNLEAILRKNFEVDATGEFVTIYLPEASDSSANQFCDESNLYPGTIAPCTYNVRLRDGCVGPGEKDSSGKCQPDLSKPRETMRSWIRIRIADLANHMSFEMESPGFLVTGGFRLQITNLPVDASLGIYAKLPAVNGQQLGNFVCRYFAPPAAKQALVLEKIDISIQPRVDEVDGKPSFFVTTLTRDLQVGQLALMAEAVADPACIISQQNEIPCEAACALIGSLLGPTSEGFNFINDLLKPALPYIVTPLANAALALLWGSAAEFNATIPVKDQTFIAKTSGRDVSILASAQPGAFTVTQRTTDPNDITKGMGLPLALGAYAELSPCVNEVPAPSPYPGQLPPTLDGMVAVQDPQLAPGITFDETYHLGFSISESFFNQLAFALRNSGLLCVQLGSDPGGLLAKGAFVPNAGLLYLLAPPLSDMAPPSAPITFRIQPGSSPTVKFGSGKQVGVDKDGKALRDSLITLTLLDTGIEFHLFAWDRYIRTFALNVDIVVGLSAFPSRDGKLMLSIDSIKADNIVEVFNELMPNYDFSKITEVLFSILSSQLNQKSLAFEVPVTQAIKDALGSGDMGVHLLDIRRDGANNDYLSGFIKLCTADDETNPANLGCFILPGPARDEAPLGRFDAYVSEVVYEAAPMLAALRADRAPAGAVKLLMQADRKLEYQVAVDGNSYGPFVYPSDEGYLYVENATLRMLGHHVLHIRSKPFARPFDPDHAGDVYVPVLVDSERPRVSVVSGHIKVEDLVTPRDRMRVQIVSDGVESAWMSVADAEAALAAAGDDADVIAMDEAGNTSIDPRALVQNVAAPEAPAASRGCSSSSGGSVAAVFTVLLGAYLISRRSRRR
ncbi:MAG: hypothetical protein IT381_09045 [Deltaproteobacteria bacterium]|nr:hypothetical protein [Deltaproteobacteria bacterium]